MEKGRTMKMAEPVGERLETAGGTTGKEPLWTEEVDEAQVPLVGKMRKLVKGGQVRPGDKDEQAAAESERRTRYGGDRGRRTGRAALRVGAI